MYPTIVWTEVTTVVLMLGVVSVVSGVDTLKRNMENTVVNYTGVEGRTAILPCTVSNLGRHKVKVAWTDQWNTVLTLNEARIIDDDRISVSRHHEDEWNLMFENVKYGDQGLYTCQINTTPALLQSVMLSVVVPPRVSSPDDGGTVTVREGDKATLMCNATGIPRPTVTWYRHGARGELKESESCWRFHRIGYVGEILVIHNVTRFCGGVYECEAENGFPPNVRRTTLVRVKFSPEVSVANKRMSQSVGKETILECIVSAYPQAEAAWKFEGRQLSNSEKYKLDIYNHQDDDSKLTLSLFIKDVQSEDFGSYTCLASNDMGKASERMMLYEHKERTKAPPTTTPTTPSTPSLSQHYIAKTAQPGSFQEAINTALMPKGRGGVVLEKHEIINTDPRENKRRPQPPKSEASFRSDSRNLASSNIPNHVILTSVASTAYALLLLLHLLPVVL